MHVWSKHTTLSRCHQYHFVLLQCVYYASNRFVLLPIWRSAFDKYGKRIIVATQQRIVSADKMKVCWFCASFQFTVNQEISWVSPSLNLNIIDVSWCEPYVCIDNIACACDVGCSWNTAIRVTCNFSNQFCVWKCWFELLEEISCVICILFCGCFVAFLRPTCCDTDVNMTTHRNKSLSFFLNWWFKNKTCDLLFWFAFIALD